MNKCKITQISDSELAISGVIDEYSEFDELIKLEGIDKLRIDFRDLTRINSSGLRLWLQALRDIKFDLIMHHCSVAITDQFSMIPNMTGPSRIVESCYLQYSCESCGREETRLLNIEDYSKDGQTSAAPEELECPECGSSVEIDHDLEVYLSFLNESK